MTSKITQDKTLEWETTADTRSELMIVMIANSSRLCFLSHTKQLTHSLSLDNLRLKTTKTWWICNHHDHHSLRVSAVVLTQRVLSLCNFWSHEWYTQVFLSHPHAWQLIKASTYLDACVIDSMESRSRSQWERFRSNERNNGKITETLLRKQ